MRACVGTAAACTCSLGVESFGINSAREYGELIPLDAVNHILEVLMRNDH